MLAAMARIRIVDAWLRCPTTPPTHQRAVMVVAESWAEQRVLMRAYANSPDQTRPTIPLHGLELAIGPAGTDPHGPWGIHVEPPADGRAQNLRDELEVAARRLAGSKGNPPRLMDEESSFDRKRTNHWSPGTPRDLPEGAATGYYEPNQAAHGQPGAMRPGAPERGPEVESGFGPQPGSERGSEPWPPRWPGSAAPGQPSAVIPGPGPGPGPGSGPAPGPAPASAPPAWSAAGWPVYVPAASPTAPTVGMPMLEPGMGPGAGQDAGPDLRPAAAAPPVSPGPAAVPSGTAYGFSHGAGAQIGAGARLGGPSGPDPGHARGRRLVSVVRRTMPIGFQLTPEEMAVLDALDAAPWLSQTRVAEIAGVVDGGAWMQQLIGKLGQHGLDLIETISGAGEPAYALRR